MSPGFNPKVFAGSILFPDADAGTGKEATETSAIVATADSNIPRIIPAFFPEYLISVFLVFLNAIL